ncbi:MAG: hypothetical protein BGP23_04690 [Lysobacterales bacterium 66-474]|nr:MAG: hypothetical protein BGP23_04690 [Xanthomonadales bacterium 66-474]
MHIVVDGARPVDADVFRYTFAIAFVERYFPASHVQEETVRVLTKGGLVFVGDESGYQPGRYREFTAITVGMQLFTAHDVF